MILQFLVCFLLFGSIYTEDHGHQCEGGTLVCVSHRSGAVGHEYVEQLVDQVPRVKRNVPTSTPLPFRKRRQVDDAEEVEEIEQEPKQIPQYVPYCRNNWIRRRLNVRKY